MTAPTDNEPATALVAVSQLSRHYGTLLAVDNINFSLHKGQVLGLLGLNGAGKSTTLQMISGCLAPTQGSIHITGIDLLENPLEAKQHIGFLPEQPPLYLDLTVDEYLRYCARLKRISKKQINRAVKLVKERCGLTGVGSRLIGNLSKGYQQRTGIAQAIIHSPRVVILDEPTVGLDPVQIQAIRQLIKQLGNDHGVILSTHILPEVQMTCDHVQIIRRGKLVFNDSVGNLRQHGQNDSLIVCLKQPPHIAELEAISDVTAVELIAHGRYRIKHLDPQPQSTASLSVAERIVSLSVEHHWGLIEITPENQSLEKFFIALTSDEPPAVEVLAS